MCLNVIFFSPQKNPLDRPDKKNYFEIPGASEGSLQLTAASKLECLLAVLELTLQINHHINMTALTNLSVCFHGLSGTK